MKIRENDRELLALCLTLAPFALVAGWTAGHVLDEGQQPYQRPALVQAAVPPVPGHPSMLDEPATTPVTVVQVAEQEPPTTAPSVPSTTTATPTTEPTVVENLVAEVVEHDVIVDEDEVDTDIPVDDSPPGDNHHATDVLDVGGVIEVGDTDGITLRPGAVLDTVPGAQP